MISALITWALVAAGFSAMALLRVTRRAAPLRVESAARAARAAIEASATSAAANSSANAAAAANAIDSVLVIRPLDAPADHELRALCESLHLGAGVRQFVTSPVRPTGLPPELGWLRSDPTTSNRKVGHVLNALAALGELPADAVVLCIDADVVADESLVRALTAAIHDGACAASAAPIPPPGQSLASLCTRGLLVQSHHSFVALDAMQLGAKAICGKALALSSDAIHEWRKLEAVVGEDLELSKALHARGRSVTVVAVQARVTQSPLLTMGAVVDRFTRWMQVLRAHRAPLFPTVPLLFAPTPVLVILCAICGSPALAAATTLLVLSRFALANRLEDRPFGLRFEWFLAELLLVLCWGRSLFLGRQVTWRGRQYRLGSGGHLTPLTPEQLT